MPTPIADARPMIDLTKLRQDAIAATQGEWSANVSTTWQLIQSLMKRTSTEDRATASHVANLSPSTAIALIEAVEAAKQVLEEVESVTHASEAALREALKPFTKE